MAVRPLLLSTACALLAISGQLVNATPKLDLERVEPVPANEEIPVMDFFRPPILRSPRINASGTHMAALITGRKDKTMLLVHDLESQKEEYVGGSQDRDIYRYNWLTDSRLVFGLSHEKHWAQGMFVVDVEDLSRAYPLLQHVGAHLVGIPKKDPRHPLVWIRNDLKGRDIGVFGIDSDLNSIGYMKIDADFDYNDYLELRDENYRHFRESYPEPKGGIVTGYMADRQGELAFAFTNKDGFSTLHRLAGEAWEECPVVLDTIDIYGAGETSGQLLVRAPGETGQPSTLRFMEAATGEMDEILIADPEYDFHGYPYRHPVTEQVLGVYYQRNGPRTIWFSEDYKKIQAALNAYFPGKVSRILGSDDSEQRFLVSAWSDRSPTTYYRIDLEERTMSPITPSRPWIDPERMRPMSMFKYKTNDGRSLDAYVTLPTGATKETPAPLVVLPHGGPWVRDTWGFDSEAQFLSYLGYAVLQPNYRGSPGYDWMFPEEDLWAFRKMHDDVTAAAKTLLKTGLIDPDRMAIMGGSFGGYLALSGAVHEPDLYRCAVTIAGVFDWKTIMQSEKRDRHESATYAYLLRKLGDPKLEEDKFNEISPLRHLANVQVPIFIAHGKRDKTASVDESKRLQKGLKKHGVPHEFMLMHDENHGIAHLDSRVEMYTRIADFLSKHLAPR